MNDVSLDNILQQQLAGLHRLTSYLVSQITAGDISRDMPQQLATCIKITMELKAKENEMLDALTDEEIEKKLANDTISQSS